MHDDLILITGATGKTGRRVAAKLAEKGVRIREASRSSTVRFDWADDSTWREALDGAKAAFLVLPHLGSREATDQVGRFANAALSTGLERVVLISQPMSVHLEQDELRATEEHLHTSGLSVTVLRPRWFFQNFSEDFLAPAVIAGDLRLPAGTGREAYVDAEDIADVAVASLLSAEHVGEDYEIAGPRLLGFSDIAHDLSEATGRPITYTALEPDQYRAEQLELGVPADWVDYSTHLYGHIASGELETLPGAVQKVLGRPPRDFRDFAAAASAARAWDGDASHES